MTIQVNLEHCMEVTVWHQNVIKPSQFPLESLLNHLRKSHFGIFVFAPDDVVTQRGRTASAVRDNVLFELGLLVGLLGRRRAFIVVPRSLEDELHLPSDLEGLTPIEYDDRRFDGNLPAALGAACSRIERAIRESGCFEWPGPRVDIDEFHELVESGRGVNASPPVAVSVCLLTSSESLRGAVEDYLEAEGWPMPVMEYNQNGIADADDLRRFVEGLKNLRRQIDAHRYKEVHFFFAGPVQACAIASTVFSNWLPIKLYQKTQSPAQRLYEYWMPLKKI